MGGKEGLEPIEKTVIDRSVRLVYQEYLHDPSPDKMPILEDLYNVLSAQPEKEAARLASALELYVTGSLKSINKYTPEGRQEIHKILRLNAGVMVWLMRHPVAGESVEFNDNRISLFAGQQGKCAITGEFLTRGDTICRRIVPKRAGGASDYSNLVLVTQAANDILNEKDAKIAWELSKHLSLDENKRKKAKNAQKKRQRKQSEEFVRESAGQSAKEGTGGQNLHVLATDAGRNPASRSRLR